MRKKHVLIIGELFYPANNIGAIRPTKLAQNLLLAGCEVDVFTSEKCSNSQHHTGAGYRIVSPCVEHGAEEFFQAVDSKPTAARARKRGKFLTDLAMTRRQWLQYNKSKAFVEQFKAEVTAGRIVLTDYDCIFTTFGPIGSILVGLEAKKMRPELRWICDFRDPMVSQIMPKLFMPFYGYLQRKSIRMADHVTTVSNGYKKRIMPKKYVDKCVVIPNGYDGEDRNTFAQVKTGEKFSFAYVGALYEGKRDLGLLFRAIRSALDAVLILEEAIEFHYAGTEGRFLRQQAAHYGLESIIKEHGQIAHDECLRLQASVRFLVMSTWNDKGEEGVFPGKLIEYMLMQKPVVNIVGGKLPNCEVTQVIRQLGLGVSCEEADKSTFEDLSAWLTEQCESYRAGKDAVFDPKITEIEARYTWKNIVKRFGELIDG